MITDLDAVRSLMDGAERSRTTSSSPEPEPDSSRRSSPLG